MTTLDPVLRDAASVRVDQNGKQLVLVDDPAALRDLSRVLAVEPGGNGIVCMCHGDLSLSFFDASGRPLAHVAGAVRHLCGWKTRRHQAKDIAKLPGDVRQRLLATARESGDDDKRQRAEHWLRGSQRAAARVSRRV